MRARVSERPSDISICSGRKAREEGCLGSKTAEPLISSSESTGSNKSVVMPDCESMTLRWHNHQDAQLVIGRPPAKNNDVLAIIVSVCPARLTITGRP